MFVQDPQCFEFMYGELAAPVRYKSFTNLSNMPEGDETPCIEVFVHAFQTGTWEIIVKQGKHIEYGMGSSFQKSSVIKYFGDSYDTCQHKLNSLLVQYPICDISLSQILHGMEGRKPTCMPLQFWQHYMQTHTTHTTHTTPE